MVKEYVTSNNAVQVKRLLRVLGQEFALSQNANSRKGGLIGLAASAIALGKVRSKFRSFIQYEDLYSPSSRETTLKRSQPPAWLNNRFQL